MHGVLVLYPTIWEMVMKFREFIRLHTETGNSLVPVFIATVFFFYVQTKDNVISKYPFQAVLFICCMLTLVLLWYFRNKKLVYGDDTLEMEKRETILLLMAKNEGTLLQELFTLEKQGYPVLSVIKEVERAGFLFRYKEYVKAAYFLEKKKNSECLTDEEVAAVLIIENTPTLKLLQAEADMTVSVPERDVDGEIIAVKQVSL